MKIGDLVRFSHERNGGPVHRVVSVMSDGMIEINDFGGYFAPHLFAIADDIAGIPEVAKTDTCEHDFCGWRAFADGNGGEQVCTKCGMGAMAYTLSLGI